MPRYWCVNFDSEACLQHGIQRHLWMMQYQYADDHGNEFQGYKKGAIRKNWERLAAISPGDWFVAYLKPQTFYAIGKVITPRKSKTAHDRSNTIEDYLTHLKSHEVKTGYVYFTPVFYEDFTDKWRHPDDEFTRYAQRIDVEKWRHCLPGGVSVKGLSRIQPNELRLAVFQVPKGYFQRIAKALAGGRVQLPNDEELGDVTVAEDDAVVEALEKSHAKSQGFQLDSETRKAIEAYAMEAASKHFTLLGYTVEDHSKNHPYDLLCTKKKERLHVEVKGTVTSGDGIILTSGEVKFARNHKGEMGLFILHSIQVSAAGKVSDGKQKVIVPWDVDDGKLNPMAFNYEVP